MDFWVIAVELFGNLMGLLMNCFPNSSSHQNGGDEGQNSMASSSSTPLPKQEYEVFLSFRGETRGGFTDHLYKGLKNSGILVFRDKEGLTLGERNWPELVQAIETSKVSILIISPEYASSQWCLNELVHILKRKKDFGQIVIPIFYRVKPSDVRTKLDSPAKVSQVCKKGRHGYDDTHVPEWKDALREVSFMTGLESEKVADGYEGKLVDMVITKVIRALDKPALVVSDDLVGVEDHVEKIRSMVNAEGSSKVRFILIHGMGGIGKTTLAMVAYNQLIHQFDSCSFLADVRETWSRDGELKLQKQLISDILGQKQSDIVSNVNKGLDVIRERFKHKKVLIVLDDVDTMKQLDTLVGDQCCFGEESMLIVTSRKTDVLNGWEDNFSYELENLSKDQSFQLFCKYAFKNSQSKLHTMATEIVSTTGGLPLALKVIGRRLCGKGEGTWEGVLKRLKDIPVKDVQSRLRISFDALDYDAQQIFLDICCLDIHYEMEVALHFWNSRKLYLQSAIDELVSMSLIKIKEREYPDGELRKQLIIHDQLRDLGREIIRNEGVENLGMRSRLWKTEEAEQILERGQGTSNVRAINLRTYYCPPGGPVRLSSKQFKDMTNLQLLRMHGFCLEGNFQELFLNLRWFELDSFGQSSGIMDINFSPKQLVILELCDGAVSEHWKGWSQMKNLKVLKLQRCSRLTTTRYFSVMKGLEILVLFSCEALEEIHPSIGQLNKTLKVLSVEHCSKLKELPKEVGKMEELRELNIMKTGIREIPFSEGYLTKLEKLYASFCKLMYIPDSLGSLVNLRHLPLCGCRSFTKIPESIGKLKSLSKLYLNETRVTLLPDSIGELYNLKELLLPDSLLKWSPTSIAKLSNLRSLEFHGNRLETLPDFSKLTNLNHLTYYDAFTTRNRVLNLGKLNRLKTLNIHGSYEYVSHSKEGENINLQLELPSCLENLEVYNCSTLRILPNFSTFKNLSELRVEGCPELVEINGLEGAESLTLLKINGIKKFSRLGSMGNTITKLSLISLDALESLLDLSTATKLGELEIFNCKSLVQIQELDRMEGLKRLIIGRCETLQTLPNLSKMENLLELRLYNCSELVEINGLEGAKSLRHLEINGCKKLSKLGSLGSTVTELRLISLDSLESLPGLSTAKNLEVLVIDNCRRQVVDQGLDRKKELPPTFENKWRCNYERKEFEVPRDW